MSSLNDLKFAALTEAGFAEGSLMDREYAWLADLNSVSSGLTLNDQWMTYLDGEGVTSGSLNDRQMNWWRSLGYGDENLLLETGDDLLLEDGGQLLLEDAATTWNDMAMEFWADTSFFLADEVAAPSDLVLTVVSDTEIDLEWADNSDNETGFSIERSLNGVTWAEIDTVTADETTYSDTGLTADTEYYYRVIATGASGNSDPSNEESATTEEDPLLTSLVAWWPLDQTSGTRVNVHNPGTHDLTDENTVTFEAGVVGNAAVFTAANNERLSCAVHDDLRILDRDMTITTWCKIGSGSDSSARVIGQGGAGGAGGGWGIRRDTTNEEIRFGARDAANTNTVETADIAITYGTWFFCIVQYTAATDQISLEVNRGTPVTATLTGGAYASNAAVFSMGASTATNVQNNDGANDETAIWHRLLTTEEKNRLYNSGAGMGYPG